MISQLGSGIFLLILVERGGRRDFPERKYQRQHMDQ